MSTILGKRMLDFIDNSGYCVFAATYGYAVGDLLQCRNGIADGVSYIGSHYHRYVVFKISDAYKVSGAQCLPRWR